MIVRPQRSIAEHSRETSMRAPGAGTTHCDAGAPVDCERLAFSMGVFPGATRRRMTRHGPAIADPPLECVLSAASVPNHRPVAALPFRREKSLSFHLPSRRSRAVASVPTHCFQRAGSMLGEASSWSAFLRASIASTLKP